MFTIKIKAVKNTRYPIIGIVMQDTEEEVEVCYEATEVLNISSGKCLIALSASIEGCITKGNTQHLFDYSGTGNPLEEGEESFKQSISNASG